MPLGNLALHTPKEIEELIKDKDPIKIRIALFFDGTLNNRKNIEERELHEQGKADKVTAEDYAKFTKDPANSYMNGRTNIAIMEPNVEETADGYDFFYKGYIPGQGAITHEADSMPGYAMAIGESGVASRAEEGVDYAVNKILNDEKGIKPQEQYIQKLTIDVFGFSRGAATARYAIHVILKGRIVLIDNTNGEAIYSVDTFSNELDRFNYIVKKDAVKVGFAGLYDTVLSYVGSQLLPKFIIRLTNILKQSAVKHAEKSLHLAAADEHRADFALHRIQSAVKMGKGEEYYLPGVHSDIGGSYNQANELQNAALDENDKIYMRTSNEGSADIATKPTKNWYGKITNDTMIINQDDPKIIEQDQADLIEQGWYTKNEIRSEVVGYDQDTFKPIESRLIVSRQGISSAYCNIPLKIMARFARDKGVELKIAAKLERIADKVLDTAIDPITGKNELKELEANINDYIAGHKNISDPDDWIADNAKLNTKDLKAIRHRHFHFSASKMSLGYRPRFEWDKDANKRRRKRYYYDA